MNKKPKKPEIPNIGPRTASARKAVVLMNRLKHRPKSVIIQTNDEIVIQVRGDYDDLVKRLKKVFKSKGKDESGGVMRIHAWKLRGMGLMNVYQKDGNDYMSVRFLHKPELGVRPPKEETPPISDAEKATMGISTPTNNHAAPSVSSGFENVPEDLDAVLL